MLARYNQSPALAAYRDTLVSHFRIPALLEPEESFVRLRGHDVHLDCYPGSGRGTVLLIHGAGAHGRLLSPFARPFVERGLSVWAPDLPGYGLTRPASAVTTYAEWIELVVELANRAAERGPVFLFGLSVGGMTALRAGQRARRVAGVMTSTLVDLRDPATFDACARNPWLGRLSRLLFRVLPRSLDALTMRLRWVAPIEKLTSVPAVARVLSRDPLLGGNRVTLGFLRSLHEVEERASSYDLPCPLLLVHPGADAWTPVSLSRPVFDAVRSPKRLVVLKNGAHAPLEQPAYDELCGALAEFVGALE